MRFTDDQYRAVQMNSNTAVLACPGSGKTRIIAGKVIRLLEDAERDVRKIACVTFTNGALDEIERRLSSSIGADLADRYIAATVHSFLLGNVVLPYCAVVPELPLPVRIAAPDSEIYESTAATVFGERINMRLLRALSQARRLRDGSPSAVRTATAHEVILFWDLLRQQGYIDYSAILYYAYQILVQHERLARIVASRFSWLVIDEYQDCSELVLDCFRLIHDNGNTKFFIVGDYDQCIYSFNGVRIPALEDFLDSIGADRLSLRDSRRLPIRIVDLANEILHKEQEMVSACDPPQVGAAAIRRTKTAASAIMKIFVPSLQARGIPFERAAIIGSNGDMLKALYTSLTENDVPVVLVSDRIYRKGVVTHFFESLFAYIRDGSARSFATGILATSKLLLETQLMLRDDTPVSTERLFMEASDAFRLLIANNLYQPIDRNLGDIYSAALGLFTMRCVSSDDYIAFRHALVECVGSMLDIPEQYMPTWDKIAEHSRSTHSMGLLTIHGAKGLEYDGVAVVGLNEGTLPFFACDDLQEELRKLYVSATRSCNVLLLASDIESGKPESRFLPPLRAVIQR